ncbi:hypothetical protein [Cellulosimicrobium marinum]|uniref:hypothetical protein n=1 Tax=Cellulosimicrobium marinum TaxID=1638992 RepID=UPI001E469496|nr:hypothetical protein [Cellulosimicrobium marinum]MCB7135365.1 hypothetical protein [Cellulosimicrobium marinum]
MALDTNGIWQYTEGDSEATASDLLNLLAASTSDRVGDFDSRMDTAEGKFGAVAGIRRTNGTNQAIPSGTTAVLVLPSAFAYAGGVSGSGGGLRAPVAGWYTITGVVRWASNGTGMRRVLLTVNNTDTIAVQEGAASGAAGSGATVTVAYPLAASDIVRLEVYQTSRGNLDVLGGTTYPFLGISLAGRL